MADVIQMMNAPVVVPASAVKSLPVDQAIDVSAYDKLELAIDTLGPGPASVTILTSMALHPSDSDWRVSANLLPTAPATALPDNTANQILSVPEVSSGKPLFRYVRWLITGGASTGAVNITGLARRG